MSVYEFQAEQRRWQAAVVPECWVIVANSVHARAEDTTLIATFDTKEMAEAYVHASMLPADWPSEQRTVQSRHRAFRPDSLLWDYNPDLYLPRDIAPEAAFPIVRRARNLDIYIDHLPINPTPPSGEMPPDVFAEDAQRRLEAK